MKKILIFIITCYQKFISPFLPASCRFYPTCSAYFVEALTKHGLLKGMCLGIYRILRCNPFNPGGYDPVPQVKTKKKEQLSEKQNEQNIFSNQIFLRRKNT